MTLPALRVLSVTAAQSFFGAARDLFHGAELLARVDETQYRAISFLSAQSLEGVLKAFLVCRQMTEKDLKTTGHNLKKLWTLAAQMGLPVTLHHPVWCEMLDRGHASPYLFRYPMGLHGMGYPPIAPMIQELAEIMRFVEGEVLKDVYASSSKAGGSDLNCGF